VGGGVLLPGPGGSREEKRRLNEEKRGGRIKTGVKDLCPYPS